LFIREEFRSYKEIPKGAKRVGIEEDAGDKRGSQRKEVIPIKGRNLIEIYG
jgi:hypothetical protein